MTGNDKIINFKKDYVLCLEGDTNTDLYQIIRGKLLVCVLNGSQVNPLATLSEGDYFGELSFFDQCPRSANLIAMEDTEVKMYATESIKNQLPTWLMLLAKSIATKIRKTDELVANHRIRRKKTGNIAALSISEQTHLFQLMKKKYEES